MAGMDTAAGVDWAARLQASLTGIPAQPVAEPPPVEPIAEPEALAAAPIHVALAEDSPEPTPPVAAAPAHALPAPSPTIGDVLAALSSPTSDAVPADLGPLPTFPLFDAMQPVRPAPASGQANLLAALDQPNERVNPRQAAPRTPVMPAEPPPGMFEDADISALDAMRADAPAEDGIVVDWFGLRTPVALAPELKAYAGTLLPRPALSDPRAPAAEWIGLAVSVATARETWRALDLGAGRGDLLLAGAVAARRLGLALSLHATEARAETFSALWTHAEANGIDPAAHRIQQAELGTDLGNPPPRGALVQDWLKEFETWDWVRIARPGALTPLLRSSVALLSARVRVLTFTTHGRVEEATAIRALPRAGWRLVAELPSVVDRASPRTAKTPGVHVWRGPLT